MIVIAREICREEDKALAHEWLVRNGMGGYAATSISGALTRRQHGLLVTRQEGEPDPVVTLAKIDEEVEVQGQVYKLGTNEYVGNVINPDGFLYMQQVSFDGSIANFIYEAGRFQLTKTIWMEQGQDTTYIRYALAEHSGRARLTLLPLCDYRATGLVTEGNEERHLPVQVLDNGIQVAGQEGAPPYALFSVPHAPFTPLDLWYWRFQLRADGNALTDLYVPGLFRTDLEPGAVFTLIATRENADAVDFEVARAFERARANTTIYPLPPSHAFTPDTFSAPEL